MLKQNAPSRQGELFRVNFLSSQTDGPFLKKDIMSNNKKSMALLTGGRQVLQSLNHFNNSMVMLQSKTKQISTLFPQNINNLTSTYDFCESEVGILFEQSVRLQKQQQKLKTQLSRVYEQQKASQIDLYNECMPLLKNLFKTVKELQNQQKDQYHLIQREISSIEMTKKVLVHGIIQCENRIIKLQNIIGQKTQQQEQEI